MAPVDCSYPAATCSQHAEFKALLRVELKALQQLQTEHSAQPAHLHTCTTSSTDMRSACVSERLALLAMCILLTCKSAERNLQLTSRTQALCIQHAAPLCHRVYVQQRCQLLSMACHPFVLHSGSVCTVASSTHLL
jgi:hypothetical protein